MIQQKVIDYILQQQSNRYPEAAIRRQLYDRGWSEVDIEDAFHSIKKKVVIAPPASGKSEYKAILLLFSPVRFFEKVKRETSYHLPILYFLTVFFMLKLAEMILSLSIADFSVLWPVEEIAAKSIILGFPLFLLIAGFLASAGLILLSLIIHLGILLVSGGNGRFLATIKASAYAGVVALGYGLILAVGRVLIQALHLTIPIAIFVGILMVFLLAFIIHFLLMLIVGIAIEHEIPYYKATLGILAFPVFIGICLGALTFILGGSTP